MTPLKSLVAALDLLSAGRWHEAEIAARAAIGDAPDAALIECLAVAAMGQHDRAAPILNRLAAAAPGMDHPCVDLKRMHPAVPGPVVERQFRACLRLAPGDEALRLAYAEFLLDADRPAEAEAVLTEADGGGACEHLRGSAQAEQDQFRRAIASFRKAVAATPGAAASWSNLGMMLSVEGCFDEAVDAHDRAIELSPNTPRLRVNRAVALLKAGLWDRAWQDYEARFDLAGTPAFDHARLLPSLRPGDSLHGATILVQHEDGFGDTLQFLRYVPMLADRGARIIVVVPPPLERLFRAIPGVTEIVTDRDRPIACHFVCPMFSLPRVFGTTPTTISPMPVYVPDTALVRRWAACLPRNGLRVGLVWAGQARPSLPGFGSLDRRRSAGLAAFEPLFTIPGLAFVSLQTGPAAGQPRPDGVTIIDPMPDVDDFADTAAIIAGLDVLVSVDTSVVHLAGLVGKPVFMLDRYDGCWRWLSDRSDSPWYPNLTIFRQQQPGDWSQVMSRIAVALAEMATLTDGTSSGGGPGKSMLLA